MLYPCFRHGKRGFRCAGCILRGDDKGEARDNLKGPCAYVLYTLVRKYFRRDYVTDNV